MFISSEGVDSTSNLAHDVAEQIKSSLAVGNFDGVIERLQASKNRLDELQQRTDNDEECVRLSKLNDHISTILERLNSIQSKLNLAKSIQTNPDEFKQVLADKLKKIQNF